MLHRLLAFVAVILFARSIAAAEEFDVRAHYSKQEVRIPMRDGVHLFTEIFTPKDMSTTYPILMVRTPYSITPYGLDAYPPHLGPSDNFARDGFIFVHQDVRGRFMSEGEFVEMRPEDAKPGQTDESTDTFDTVEWLLKNVPGNNGKVGLIGISYPGFYANAGLINAHPALLAVSPQAPMSNLYMGDDAYHNGALFLLANFDFYTSFRKQHNPEVPQTGEKHFDYRTKDGYDFYLGMGPLLGGGKQSLSASNPYWADLARHTTYDSFWKSRDILPHLKNIKPAVLIVGGWFDAEDLSGTLKTFRAIQTQSPQTSQNLVMGPWVHGGWSSRKNSDRLSDISFGPDTAHFFQDEIELPFFRHFLKQGPDPDLPKAYVFQTGKNVWRKKEQWPPANVTPQRFYLQAQGQLSMHVPDVTSPGNDSAFDSYVSDPAHPVPFLNKATLQMNTEYMDADQRFVHSRPDVLTYQSDLLSEDTVVAGPISPSLFVSTTGSDSDFVVKVIDVYPSSTSGALSGYEQLVRGEPFRGKFRHSFEHPEPFQRDQIQEIHFTMPDVYHCFAKGHRIMVQIQSSWFPLVDRNPQTFTDIPTAKAADYVKATERIYRSGNTASFIEFDVEQ